ncbi:MAG: hypothetical protein U9R68_07820 [Planctomycetota bacterium]|nr:hypothetical protein [Planctomycetota bacterium]
MEKHFLESMMEGEGKPEFRAKPWYNPHGDCIIYQIADEAVVAERVDEVLTIYHSAFDGRPVGFQVKGVGAMIRKFGLEALAIESESDAKGVRRVSVAALLLAAYEEGPRTLGRRRAYAAAMEGPLEKRSIPTDELQPA